MWVASPDNFFFFVFFLRCFNSFEKRKKKRGERGKQRGKLIKITYTLFTERKTLVSTGTTHPSGSYKMTAAECTNILSFTKTVHRLPCNKVCLSPLFRFFFFSHPQHVTTTTSAPSDTDYDGCLHSAENVYAVLGE